MTDYLFLPAALRTRTRGKLTKCFRVVREMTLKKHQAQRARQAKMDTRKGPKNGEFNVKVLGLSLNDHLYALQRNSEALFRLPEAWTSYCGFHHGEYDSRFADE